MQEITPQASTAPDRRAVSEGRKPLSARRKDLAAIKAKAVELYGVPAAGFASLAPIDAGFKFAPLDSDSELHYLQVESLLSHAADLLGRCLESRRERDLLQIEKWKLQLELDQFLRTEAIHERELESGVDTLPYERAFLDGSAEHSLAELHNEAETQIKDLTHYLVQSGFNKRMAAHELTTWLSAYPLKDTGLNGDDAAYTFDGKLKSKPDHLFEAAQIEADEAAWEQIYNLAAQQYTSAAASEAARQRKESLNLLTNYSLADIGFRREKSQIVRDAAWEKAYQSQSPGGLLNYAERIAPAELRFNTDFREAIACLTAAGRGLQEVYGYTVPLPKEGTAGYFDEALIWARKAQNRMAQLSRLDQHYVLAVSLKDLTKGGWEAGRSAAEWSFDLPDDVFKGQSNVRLRGIGIAVVGAKQGAASLVTPAAAPKKGSKAAAPPPEPPKPQGYWAARVSVPQTATIKSPAGTNRELDQKALPVCFLGRVSDADTSEPEITGNNILHNASPIGKQWKIALSPKSTGGTATDTLEDVQLYLQVAVRG